MPLLLLHGGALLMALGTGAFARTLYQDPGMISRWLKEHAGLDELGRNLSFVRSPVSPVTFRLGQFACVPLALLFAQVSLVAGAVLMPFFFLPPWLLQRRMVARRERIEQQLAGWMTALSRSLQAVPSLGEAIEVSASLSEAPLSEELHVLLGEVSFGRPLDDALNRWSARVQSRVLKLSLAILQVGRRTGGRLGEVLETGAASLREMERLEGVLRTKTAEGRIQALVVGVVPFPLCFAIFLMDPGFFIPLYTTGTGYVLSAVAVVFWIGAILSARKILAVQL